MKNRILSVSFNPDQFPVSPRTGGEIIELEHHVICLPYGESGGVIDNTMDIDPSIEEGYVVCLHPDNQGDVKLEAHIIDADLSVGFRVINQQNEIESTISINTHGYFGELEKCLKNAGTLDYSEELDLRIKAIKGVFHKAISGNSAFWYRFQNDFANAVAPLRKDPVLTDAENIVLKSITVMPPGRFTREMCADAPRLAH